MLHKTFLDAPPIDNNFYIFLITNRTQRTIPNNNRSKKFSEPQNKNSNKNDFVYFNSKMR